MRLGAAWVGDKSEIDVNIFGGFSPFVSDCVAFLVDRCSFQVSSCVHLHQMLYDAF